MEGSGNIIQAVYQYFRSEHKHRLGHNIFNPKNKDFCVCVKHSGDCFNDYIVIRMEPLGLYKKVGVFGAYAFGDEIEILDNERFHLLLAGRAVPILL